MTFKDSNVKPNEGKFEESTGQRTPPKTFNNFDSLLKENLNGLKLHKLIEIDKVQNILDLCTGSGCLAVLACGVFPSVLQVDAVDLSSDAIDVANINIKNKSLQNKITAYQGDLYNALSNKNRKIKYNLIISNPPYVDLEGMRNLPREFSYEPSLALNGGRDGLDIVNRILVDASENLAETGVLLCEIGRCQPQFRRKYPEFSRKILWVDTENSTGEVFLVTKNILLKYFG
jgi:ribosomal protein L3 glutamine methyltransferase